MRLTTKELWDSRHEISARSTGMDEQAREGWIRKSVDNARRRQGAEIGQSYGSFAFHRLLKTHLPIRSDWSAIEIGSAPGGNLVALHRDFGYQPYGVEYSHTGVLLTQETFRKHGFDPANVIEADLFDQVFQSHFQKRFDIVFSLGFIEHFDPPDKVVALHVNLLRPGGYLVCQIPNMQGAFYPFLWLFARDHLKLHNCTIMRKAQFRRVFEPFGLDVKFCGYVGALQFHGSPLRHERSLRGYAAGALDSLQDILDHCMFMFYRGHFPGSCLSASLVFIGQRVS